MGKINLLFGIFAMYSITSCVNDNVDELRPQQNDTSSVTIPQCDTTTITISYVHDIVPIMENSCGSNDNNCHLSGNTASGVVLDNYIDLNGTVLDGSLLGTILHESGYSPMPDGGGQLDNCSINKIKSWINHGAVQN